METLTTKELKAMARDMGVKGWWDMKKADLIEAIKNCKDVDIIIPEAPETVEPEADVSISAEEENISEDDSTAKKKNQKRLIKYNGKTQTLTAWAKELGIRHQTLYNRIIMKGWEIDRAFEKPTKKEVPVNAEDGERK